MNTPESSTRTGLEPAIHEIRVEGRLDDRWTDWVEGLTFSHGADGGLSLLLRTYESTRARVMR